MEIKYGHELQGAAELPGPAVLVTVTELRDKVEAGKVLVAGGMDRASLDKLAADCEGAATIIALGPGRAIAAGRYAAWKIGARLVAVPAPLDGAEFADARVWAFENGTRTGLGDKDADLALIDYDLIWSRAEGDTRASAGAVLATLTAVEDWKRGGEGYEEDTAEKALEVVSEMMDRADEIFDLTESGIRALAEALAAREQLAAAAGHRRMIESAEHALADLLEARAGRPLPRGAVLCLATVLMIAVQGKDPRAAKQFLHWIDAPWKPDDLGLSNGAISSALADLPNFGPAQGSAVVRETEFSGEVIARVMASMRESIIRNSFQERDD